MEVSNETGDKQHKSVEQIEKETDSIEEKEPVKQMETNQEIELVRKEESAGQNDVDGKIKSKQETVKSRPIGGRPRNKKSISNIERLLLWKAAGGDRPQYRIPEPEQWESRLRQSGRESIRNKIKTAAVEILEMSREQLNLELMKKRAAERAEQNSVPEFTFIKVEGDVGISDEHVEQFPQQIGISELGFVKVEVDDQTTNESAERLPQQSSFVECDTKFENCTSSRENENHPVKKPRSRYHFYKERRDKRRAKETPDERLTRIRLARSKRLVRLKRNRLPCREQQSARQSKNRAQKVDKGRRTVTKDSASKSISTPSIRTETKTDILGNLIDFICRTQHSDHPQRHRRLQTFGNLCTSRSSDYILSVVIWHKLNGRIDDD